MRVGSTQVTEGDALDLAAFPPLLTGDAIASASIGSDQNGRPAIDFVLTPAGPRHSAPTPPPMSATTSRSARWLRHRRPGHPDRITTARFRSPAGGWRIGPDEAAAFVAVRRSAAVPARAEDVAGHRRPEPERSLTTGRTPGAPARGERPVAQPGRRGHRPVTGHRLETRRVGRPGGLEGRPRRVASNGAEPRLLEPVPDEADDSRSRSDPAPSRKPRF